MRELLTLFTKAFPDIKRFQRASADITTMYLMPNAFFGLRPDVIFD